MEFNFSHECPAVSSNKYVFLSRKALCLIIKLSYITHDEASMLEMYIFLDDLAKALLKVY